MKRIFIPLILACLLYSCSPEQTSKKISEKEKSDIAAPNVTEIKDDSTIVNPEKSTGDYFRDFLSALEKKDFEQFEQFISPSFSNSSNEIWYQAMDYSDESLEITKPFRKQDWRKYYLNVFRQEFIETVRSLKLDEITKKEELESQLFKKDKMNYKCRTYFLDKQRRELVIRLELEIYQEDEDIYSESSHIFHFTIDKYGRPLFTKFMMAG